MYLCTNTNANTNTNTKSMVLNAPYVSVHKEHNPEVETSTVVLIQFFQGHKAQKGRP